MSTSSKTAVVYTCSHADSKYSNERFTWLGKFLYDIKPDYVVDLGDGADMRSLNSYDTRYPQVISALNYEQDINVYNDAQERIRNEFRKNKRKRPAFYGFEGNHENRIKKAIAERPQLAGDTFGISFAHLGTNKWFDEYHEYENGAPKVHTYDGIDYAHFVGAGAFGRPIAGQHHAYALLQKRYRSTTVGHSHKRGVFFRDDTQSIGLVAGCYKGGDETWAGQANQEWWKGVVVKRQLDNGMYEPEFVSLETLENKYG
jgi:hypothetical protein